MAIVSFPVGLRKWRTRSRPSSPKGNGEDFLSRNKSRRRRSVHCPSVPFLNPTGHESPEAKLSMTLGSRSSALRWLPNQ